MPGWTTPPTFTTGEVVPASKLTTLSNDLAFLAAVNGGAVNTSETTTSTSYTDLTTAGPSVTITTGGKAAVFAGAYVTNSSAAQDTFMGVAVSGATTIAALDVFRFGVPVANVPAEYAGFVLILSLNSGSNTFTAKYRVGGGTGTFANRKLLIFPLA